MIDLDDILFFLKVGRNTTSMFRQSFSVFWNISSLSRLRSVSSKRNQCLSWDLLSAKEISFLLTITTFSGICKLLPLFHLEVEHNGSSSHCPRVKPSSLPSLAASGCWQGIKALKVLVHLSSYPPGSGPSTSVRGGCHQYGGCGCAVAVSSSRSEASTVCLLFMSFVIVLHSTVCKMSRG